MPLSQARSTKDPCPPVLDHSKVNLVVSPPAILPDYRITYAISTLRWCSIRGNTQSGQAAIAGFADSQDLPIKMTIDDLESRRNLETWLVHLKKTMALGGGHP